MRNSSHETSFACSVAGDNELKTVAIGGGFLLMILNEKKGRNFFFFFFFYLKKNLAISRKTPHVSSAIFQNGDHVTMVPQPLA